MRCLFILFIAALQTPLLQAENLGKPNQDSTPSLTMEAPVNPESFMGKNMQAALSDVLSNMGYRLNVVFYPSRRGLEELKHGRVDGTLGRIGNVSEMLQASHLIKINFPILSLHVTRWCRKDLDRNKPILAVGSRLGSLVAMMITPHFAPGRIQLNEIRDQKASVSMLHKDRLDCLLSNDSVLGTDGITAADLKNFDRFDLMTVQAFPWISRKHQALKAGLEAGLRAYAFPKIFHNTLQALEPACENQFNRLCPDGLLFLSKVDL